MSKDFYRKLLKNCKWGFTLTELVVVMVVMTLIVMVTLPISRKKMEKVDYFAYYMAYTTMQDISANIIAQNSYNIDNIAMLDSLKFLYLNAVALPGGTTCPQCYVYSTVQNKCVPLDYDCEPTLVDPGDTPSLEVCTGTCYVTYYQMGEVYKRETHQNMKQSECTNYSGNTFCPSCTVETSFTPGESCLSTPEEPLDPEPETPEPDNPDPDDPDPDNPDNSPLTARQLCEAIKNKYNTSASDCTVPVATVNTAVESDTLGTVEPHITLSNGLRLYIATEAQSISQLADAEKAERIGYTIYVDANGKNGKSLIYQDIFPFYMLLSGKVIPGYNPAIVAGAINHDNLSINVLYDDYSNNKREVKFLLKDANFRRAACATGYVTSTTYCGDKVKYDKCKVTESDCRFMLKKPFKIF